MEAHINNERKNERVLNQKESEAEENSGCKQLKRRANCKMKLELALFCRDYYVLHNKNPRFSEVRKHYV